tara:strand:- start:895 stop:1617 length:723 start_codon:yes stop_codon:yes gene_type:complete
MKKTITIVDDDHNILTSVSIALDSEGFIVKTFSDGEKALVEFEKKPSDLLILDIKMPKMDGLDLLLKIRKRSNVPIIFLTSKDDEIDEVLGLKMGADDYIKKPFSQRLLLERVRTLIRRSGAKHIKDETSSFSENESESEKEFTRGELSLDFSRHLCTWKNQEIQLTVTEFLILETLAIRPGHVKSRDQLMDAAYGDQIFVDDRTVDSHIKRLRKKFRSVDNSFNCIETLYGIGYKFRDQ